MKKFREANSPKKIVEGIDNAGVDLVNFFMNDNYRAPVSSTGNVSVFGVEYIAAE